MNRSVLEGDPHALLEGMAIAGYAIATDKGYVYCRAEYPLALQRLRVALGQAQECGLLGDDILGSGFNFHVKIKEGAGAFVCGEETALIASIEGFRGMPRPRPPFPTVSGLWGKPTIIKNVETLVCVSSILGNGAEWFAQCGTEKSKGTKAFTLVGKVKYTGLVEVPLTHTEIFDAAYHGKIKAIYLIGEPDMGWKVHPSDAYLVAVAGSTGSSSLFRLTRKSLHFRSQGTSTWSFSQRSIVALCKSALLTAAQRSS